jgi:hypothetical protein
MSNPVLLMAGQSMMQVRTERVRKSRRERKAFLSHRSRDRAGAIIVSFDELYPLFESQYPWQIKLNNFGKTEDNLTAVLRWCADNFGQSDYFMPYVRSHEHRSGRSRNIRLTTRARWNHLGWNFYFKTQEDATLFRVCHG